MGKIILALIFAFVGYLFWQAGRSAKVDDQREVQMVGSPTLGTPDDTIQRIAFGSCNRQDKPQGYWDFIAEYHPDQWLWLGDNIYGDSDEPSVLAAKYAKQKGAPEYMAFTEKIPVYGIYDDHDYGVNDGDKNWPLRDTAKTMMLDFLDVSADSPARQRAGAYQTYLLGTAERQVRLILLDTRYFRDELLADRNNPDQRYQINQNGDILGEAQWNWLENILKEDQSAVTIIASSIQVLATEHAYEKWSLFPSAKRRLLDLVRRHPPQNLIFLSGDRHIAEAAVAHLHEPVDHDWTLKPRSEASKHDITLLEVTSSGLTHSYESADELNPWRISPLVGERNFGLMTIDWSAPNNPILLIQVLSPEKKQEFFRVAMQSAKLLTDADQFDYTESMTKILKPCPESPNCVSTQTSQKDKKMEPLTYSGDLATAKQQLLDLVNGMSRTKLLENGADYLHFSFTTFPIPFKDDVEFIFDDAAKQIHFRSASRVGYSDLGVNARRMKKITQQWQERQIKN